MSVSGMELLFLGKVHAFMNSNCGTRTRCYLSQFHVDLEQPVRHEASTITQKHKVNCDLEAYLHQELTSLFYKGWVNR